MKSFCNAFAVLMAALCTASAAAALPLTWRADWPDAKPVETLVHRGTDIELQPTWVINKQPADTNGWTFATFCQTNAVGPWFGPMPGAFFSHTNDVGAASYNVIVRAEAPGGGVNYTAFARLRMLDSPGYAPGVLPLPAKSIDFADVAVFNAPYYTKAETEAKIVELAPAPGNYAAVSNAAMNAASAADLTAETTRATAAESDLMAEVTSAKTAIDDKVSKAGDTMTGGLTVPNLTVGSREAGSTIGANSTAEGYNTTAEGYASHAEGDTTTASNWASHAEGYNTTASGEYSHAEGDTTTAGGNYAHAEGMGTTASGEYSHAEGEGTTAGGNYAHAEGYNTTASGEYSHAEGSYTIAQNVFEHAQGRFNISHKASESFGNSGNTLSSIGFGTSGTDRRNAVETMQDGKTYIYGIGGYDGTNPTGAGVQDLATVMNGKLAPGDYATVSNAAVNAAITNALQDAELESLSGSVSTLGDTKADRSELADFATPADVYRIVAGTNVVLVVTNYNSAVHAPSMKLQHLDPESGEYVTYWDEARGHGITLTNAMDYADGVAARLDAAKAPRAWSRTTSGLGADAPEGTTFISTPVTHISGGFEFEKKITARGTVWTLCSTSLAAGSTTNGFFEISALDGTPVFSVEKTDSVLVGVNASAIAVVDNACVISVPAVADTHPFARVATTLVQPTWYKETEDGMPAQSPATVSWSGQSGAWVATVDFGASPQGFVFFEYLQEGGVKIVNSAVVDLSQGVHYGGATYMPTVSGSELKFIRQ